MISIPRSLLALPADVLLEILAHLLVDSPRSPNRAAVVRSCSTLHELGLPLLHRVVDLTDIESASDTFAAYEGLFGVHGSLTSQGRTADLASSVVQLRIGGLNKASNFQLPTLASGVRLPRCTSLSYDAIVFPHFRWPELVLGILAELPVTTFRLLNQPDPFAVDSFSVALSRRLFGTLSPPWKDLREVCFCGTLWSDEQDDSGPAGSEEPDLSLYPRIALVQWAFKVLVVELPELPQSDGKDARDIDSVARQSIADFFDLFFRPVQSEKVDRWWTGLERIELRVAHWVETKFRHQLVKQRKAGPLARLQQRLLPMVVFVGEDGEETRLMEEDE